MTHQQVQQIARETMNYARSVIRPGMSLSELRSLCEQKLLSLGADSFWYWDVGAFIFSGDETAISVSGRTYQTSDRLIAENDLITIDLSPQHGDTWGDYARTIVVENGRVVSNSVISHPEWKQGLLMEETLHSEFIRFASPQTTFEELYVHINGLIEANGFINLDFNGNLGHSIERRKEDRVYTEKGNKMRLGDVQMFTFEPHISLPCSCYGYKKENIYFFENGTAREL